MSKNLLNRISEDTKANISTCTTGSGWATSLDCVFGELIKNSLAVTRLPKLYDLGCGKPYIGYEELQSNHLINVGIRDYKGADQCINKSFKGKYKGVLNWEYTEMELLRFLGTQSSNGGNVVLMGIDSNTMTAPTRWEELVLEQIKRVVPPQGFALLNNYLFYYSQEPIAKKIREVRSALAKKQTASLDMFKLKAVFGENEFVRIKDQESQLEAYILLREGHEFDEKELALETFDGALFINKKRN